MKPEKLALVIAGSVVGFVVLVGLAMVVALQFVHLAMDDADFVGRVEPAMPAMAALDFIAENPPVLQPVAPADLGKVRGTTVKTAKLSGPYTHGNLDVFLVHGPDALAGQTFLTLHEGLQQKRASVHETGLASLTIENRSEEPLFIQSGDIVKGGTQDRTIQYDQLVPAHSGRVPLASFCVEQGRSGPRGFEATAFFSGAAEQLPGKSLRLANLYRHSQWEIWQGVSRLQANLSRNLGDSVQSTESASSLQLTLEHQRLHQAIENYLQELLPALNGKEDAIGLAVAVNGQIQHADVYASAALFRKLLPKLLKASAIEALAERTNQGRSAAPSTEALQTLLADAAKGTTTRQDVNDRVHMIRQETDRSVLFDTCDRNRQNLVVHRCVLVK